jgi:hypothetical protein
MNKNIPPKTPRFPLSLIKIRACQEIEILSKKIRITRNRAIRSEARALKNWGNPNSDASIYEELDFNTLISLIAQIKKSLCLAKDLYEKTLFGQKIQKLLIKYEAFLNQAKNTRDEIEHFSDNQRPAGYNRNGSPITTVLVPIFIHNVHDATIHKSQYIVKTKQLLQDIDSLKLSEEINEKRKDV